MPEEIVPGSTDSESGRTIDLEIVRDTTGNTDFPSPRNGTQVTVSGTRTSVSGDREAPGPDEQATGADPTAPGHGPEVPAAGTGPAEGVPLTFAERLDRLDATVATLHRGLASGNERAAARERVIDRQYEDIERLRAGERQSLLRPMLVELRRLRDDLLRQAAGLPENLPSTQAASLLESFAYSTELILGRAGVEVLRPNPGTPFDPTRQRAAGMLPAPSPELDGTVAEVVSDGYFDLATDRVLATATVRVQRWQEPAPVIAPDDPDEAARPEAGLPEAGLPEAGLPEAGLPEAGLPEAGLPEAGLPEAGLPEAGLPEAGLSEAGLSEAGLSEATARPVGADI
ncbi:nucleotide exchange factor GrpE [Plantactinospora soyae]|uniref:Molecular chaperone GrpE (Heat shock protein) n=1 Tax=Plantactinospora soyae TaxID=1544732 RepID=A0A927MCG3_9ACTN|nr:nucleotide exchange factor GrpE [Plantactinospora soyae]MBE1491919.1 molecular chaperone GrpE (heat shock protein) [Plantactinospora soyae]